MIKFKADQTGLHSIHIITEETKKCGSEELTNTLDIKYLAEIIIKRRKRTRKVYKSQHDDIPLNLWKPLNEKQFLHNTITSSDNETVMVFFSTNRFIFT